MMKIQGPATSSAETFKDFNFHAIQLNSYPLDLLNPLYSIDCFGDKVSKDFFNIKATDHSFPIKAV